MRLVLALVLSVAASPAFANALTLIGDVGGRAIVVELTEPVHGAVAGRYAYRDDGADVPLRPVSSDGEVWILAEEAPCSEGTCIADDDGNVAVPPIAADWEIHYDPQTYIATVTRTPRGAKIKPQSFELAVMAWRKFADEPTAFALHDRSARLSFDDSLPLDWKHAPYEMELLATGSDMQDLVESNGVTWSYATDSRSGLTFPRLVTTTAEIDTLAVALDAHFYRMSLSALDCKAFRYAGYGSSENLLDYGGHTAGFEDEQITLTYVSPLLASWSQSGSLYCQGAHPYNHLDNYTLDVTGLPLDWRKVFSAIVPRPWFSPSEDVADIAAASADPDSYSWGPDLDLIAFVRAHTPADIFDNDAELLDVCFSDQAIADQLSYRVVGQGDIMFTLSGFPHVSSVCDGDLFSAPLSDLEPFLAETATDYFPALGGGPQQ